MAEASALRGLRVLVTRPEAQQQDLLAAIAANGGSASSLPMLAIKPIESTTEAAANRAKIQNLDSYSAIIFVSSNAATLGAELIKTFWPQFPVDVSLFAIGPGTAKTLQTSFYPLPIPKVFYSKAGSTSEDLLAQNFFAENPGVHPREYRSQKILIVKGRGGREALQKGLEDKGCDVETLELYERQAVVYAPGHVANLLQQNAINVIVTNSGDTVAALSQSLAAEQCEVPVLVPSKRVAGLAKNHGFAKVIVSCGADSQSLITALAELAKSQTK